MIEGKTQLYCDADESGNMTRVIYGTDIIPTSPFRYFFMVSKIVIANLDKFYISNGELKQKESTTLIPVEEEKLTTEQQLEEMKKQMEEMKKLIGSLTNS